MSLEYYTQNIENAGLPQEELAEPELMDEHGRLTRAGKLWIKEKIGVPMSQGRRQEALKVYEKLNETARRYVDKHFHGLTLAREIYHQHSREK